MRLNTLIIGAGAIGCLIGGKLALNNQFVTLAGRPTFADAVRARGLLLTDENGQHTVRNVRAVGSVQEAFARAESAFDLAILTVKSYDTAAALADLLDALRQTGAPPPAVLSVQNGVGNEEEICAALPAVTVVAGSITTPVSVEGPGAIHVDKPRYNLGLSPWRPSTDTELFRGTCAMLAQAGFAVKVYDSAEGMKWTKLLMNMMGNACCAILDEAPEQAFADPRIVDLEIAAWREALHVMHAAHIPALDMDSYPFRYLAPLIRFAPNALIRPILKARIGGARGGKLPSLHIDLHGGKAQNEVPWLNGAVVKRGEQVGVAAPVNRLYTETAVEPCSTPRRPRRVERQPRVSGSLRTENGTRVIRAIRKASSFQEVSMPLRGTINNKNGSDDVATRHSPLATRHFQVRWLKSWSEDDDEDQGDCPEDGELQQHTAREPALQSLLGNSHGEIETEQEQKATCQPWQQWPVVQRPCDLAE